MKIIEILNKLKIFKYHQIGKFSNIIVRIEFSPLVEIGVNKGHYYPEETTDEGPTQVDAETDTSFKTYQ